MDERLTRNEEQVGSTPTIGSTARLVPARLGGVRRVGYAAAPAKAGQGWSRLGWARQPANVKGTGIPGYTPGVPQPSPRNKPEYIEARRLRSEDRMGYVAIGKAVGIPWSTVKHWVSDIPVTREEAIAAHILRRKQTPGRTKESVKRRLIEERGHRCQVCGLETWADKPIALEIHKEERALGYVDDNVLLLCPNCHSLTDTWRGRGKIKRA